MIIPTANVRKIIGGDLEQSVTVGPEKMNEYNSPVNVRSKVVRKTCRFVLFFTWQAGYVMLKRPMEVIFYLT